MINKCSEHSGYYRSASRSSFPALGVAASTWAQESQLRQDDGGENAGGQEQVGATVVAGGDAPPVLEAAEGVLDSVPPAVKDWVVSDRQVAAFPGWDARLDASTDQGIAEPVNAVASIRQDRLARGSKESMARAPT